MIKTEKKYFDLIRSYKDKADDISNDSFAGWKKYINHLLNRMDVDLLMIKLRVSDTKRYEKNRKFSVIEVMLASLTGFDPGKIHGLRTRPASDRELMFAAAYAAGVDFSGLFEELKGNRNIDRNDIDTFFEKAMMPKPDLKDIDDYICVCANMIFDEALQSGQHISSKTNLYGLQNSVRRQIHGSAAAVYGSESWENFYNRWYNYYGLSTEYISEKTGLPKKPKKEDVGKPGTFFIRDWNKQCPDNYEHLYMICIMFHLNTLQTSAVFDRFYNSVFPDKKRRPDLNDQEDLRWLYLVENYWKLDSLTFNRQSSPIQRYIIDYLRASKKVKLKVIDYCELFRNLTFTAVNPDIHTGSSDDTYTINGMDTLIRRDMNPGLENHLIRLVGEKENADPLAQSNTQIAVGASMDLLHATDPHRILWFRHTGDTENTANEEKDMFDLFFSQQKKTDTEKLRASGSLFLKKWIGNNALNPYLKDEIYYADIDGSFDSANDHGKVNTVGSQISKLINMSGEFPKRRDLIIFGVILNMPYKVIDELLKKYGYQKLNQDDYTENLLIQILRDAEKVFRQFFVLDMPFEVSENNVKLNTGKIKSDREKFEGSRVVLQGSRFYPKWFENDTYDADIEPSRVTFEDGSKGELNPNDIWEGRWSIRLHVRFCLLSAGLEEDNWLVDGLRNNYWEENPKDFMGE